MPLRLDGDNPPFPALQRRPWVPGPWITVAVWGKGVHVAYHTGPEHRANSHLLGL